MEHTYWLTQSSDKPLFPDIAWSKPEQRSQAGHLGIIGGNKLGFAGVAEAYSVALETGVGKATVLLPDVLKKRFQRQFSIRVLRLLRHLGVWQKAPCR